MIFEGHLDGVLSMAFSLDNRLLASGSFDDTIRIWDVATGTLRNTLEGHSEGVFSVALSPDGQLLASGSYDNEARIWDISTGTLHQSLTLDGGVTDLNFTEDSRYLNTNLGAINIQTSYNNGTWFSLLSGTKVGLFIQEDHWVTLRGKRLLWLPSGYRPTDSYVVIRNDGTLILGHRSGRISFLKFHV
jgi:WD40 repeat protein